LAQLRLLQLENLGLGFTLGLFNFLPTSSLLLAQENAEHLFHYQHLCVLKLAPSTFEANNTHKQFNPFPVKFKSPLPEPEG
jgi:hypothetical protein